MFSFKPQHYRQWYIACTTAELNQRKPISRIVLGIPLVLFRGGQGQAVALCDRCPHRNIPLSQGWLETIKSADNPGKNKTHLVCRYHGWQFDAQGHCQAIPGLCSFRADSRQDAIAYPTREQQGFVWVYPTNEPGNEPKNEQINQQPYYFTEIDQPHYSTFQWQITAPVSLPNAAENFLDATHTHFVHSGLVRSNQTRRPVTVTITRQADRVEATYSNEQQISGWIYRLLAPGCRDIVSIGRFLLPAIAQIEYRSTDNDSVEKSANHLIMTLAMTPISEQQTMAYVIVSFAWRWPHWLGRLLAQPLFYWAMQQDLSILKAQAQNITQFGDEQFTLTELDILRPHIMHLLNQSASDQPTTNQFTFRKTTVISL
jgi:phenylpropionate dioxygenase-like ring-hydroxylating dioxygenase large terminal subunit